MTTIVNLSNHSYFNLAGVDASPVLDHVIELHADFFTPVNSQLIPTGELRRVAARRWTFASRQGSVARIDGEDEQLRYGGGFDHNWVINTQWRWAQSRGAGCGSRQRSRPGGPHDRARCAVLYRQQPRRQYHRQGRPASMGADQDFCLETQHFPDSPNHPTFPSTLLRPGETYRSETVYRFLRHRSPGRRAFNFMACGQSRYNCNDVAR